MTKAAEAESKWVAVSGKRGGAPFVLLSDHAGQVIPSHLQDLGLSAAERARHIGWDIGIDGVGRILSGLLECVLIEQVCSRLVIDCNRAPGHRTSVVTVSDGTLVPGNQNLSPAQRKEREETILHPYHDRITRELDARQAAALPSVIVALHSFTPEMNGVKRPWHAGLLHNHDSRLAHIMIALLREEGLTVGDNEPYALTDTSDYTVPKHGEQRSLPYIELEIRQDLITSPQGQLEWAQRLARLLPQAWSIFCQKYGGETASAREQVS
ncbi:N-formylglutamate amidohydrolase [Acetobacter thailandicus]|uniref:N-formylglutamate amidohydrolase n=1 Tax=Acetobacter thailandicus TaxID=1502842 RepID=UPI001BADA481|nr:N-formylglutamate amidohydrolase [Acetobacter thailandicus]MBS0985534.1 N-formylglutamate amidohydrolase [Acetobacter thailandicus]MBS1002448.1 N-formylglutamate amidohydrolase [Acetobacter thailandicus]